MVKNAFEKIPIGGKEIIATADTIDIDKILFDELNPRISLARDSHIMGTGKNELGQTMIAYILKSQATYNDLKRAIRSSGGATIPIWVYPINNNKYGVIEGNTRLRIHKELAEDDKKYNKINCLVLPEKIDDEIKDYIRLICHLRGATEWDKYEQSKYLYNLYHLEKFPVKELVKITKLSESDILQDIEAYTIMNGQFREKFGDSILVHKYSYFKEYVKDKKLRNTMYGLKLNDDDFCDWVGQNKIYRAMDVRKLNDILMEKRSRDVFLTKDLDRALEILRDIVPEKSDKIFMLMADISVRLGKLEFSVVEEIRDPKSNKSKIVKNLVNKLNTLLGVD